MPPAIGRVPAQVTSNGLLATHCVALVLDQLSVLLPPWAIELMSTVSETTTGEPTTIVSDCCSTAPPPPRHVRV